MRGFTSARTEIKKDADKFKLSMGVKDAGTCSTAGFTSNVYIYTRMNLKYEYSISVLHLRANSGSIESLLMRVDRQIV